MKGAKVITFASKDVGYECLKHLVNVKTPINALVVGTKRDHQIINYAKLNGINHEIYNKNTQLNFINENKKFDWYLNLFSPHILIADFLDLFKHKLNTHPTLVPFCRGNDGAAWTIRNQFPAGVSLIEMNDDIDAGDIYAQKSVEYNPMITKGKELHNLLKKENVKLFKDNWVSIFNNDIKPKLQKGEIFLYKRKDTEFDRKRLSSENLGNLHDVITWINAHDFSPKTTAELIYEKDIYKISIQIEKKKK